MKAAYLPLAKGQSISFHSCFLPSTSSDIIETSSSQIMACLLLELVWICRHCRKTIVDDAICVDLLRRHELALIMVIIDAYIECRLHVARHQVLGSGIIQTGTLHNSSKLPDDQDEVVHEAYCRSCGINDVEVYGNIKRERRMFISSR